jgi:hypothetical protein
MGVFKKMDNYISYCGIDCSNCPAYIAYKTNNSDIQKEAAIKFSKIYKKEISPSQILCSGCLNNDEPKFFYCHNCKIRECAYEKDLINCGYCPQYPCNKLDDIFSFSQEAKYRLDNISAEFLD